MEGSWLKYVDGDDWAAFAIVVVSLVGIGFLVIDEVAKNMV